MDKLTYGAGIRILAQAEALIMILGKAKEALVLADQLEPKIQELAKVKTELSEDVESLRKNKASIIAEIKDEKDRIISEQAAELATMKAKADREAVEAKKKLQDDLGLLNHKIETKTKELTALEKTFKERKSALDSEISKTEAVLKKAEEKRAEMKAIL